ncbi:hypothetical protein [Actinoplanes sp. G11-F43]|uniref:hypothetical protein n=1 Tax=Actinoplanes sp. G11-F43 TaxID=3424130 RepID=UPI003D33E569
MAVRQPVPLALMAVGVLAGGGGATAGAIGGIRIKRAAARKREDATRYNDRHTAHLTEHEKTNVALQDFGRLHEQAHRQVVFRMRDFLVRQNKQVLMREHRILDGIDSSHVLQVSALPRFDGDIEDWARGILRTAAIGPAAWMALWHSVKQFARASTGTPINKLRGAAAERAGRAYLGGGSIASGGGGMALGTLVQRIAIGGLVLLAAGLTTWMQGSRKQTEADEVRTAVDIAVQKFAHRDELFRGVRLRAQEKHDVLSRLAAEATEAFDLLESEHFDMAVHGVRLQKALILVKAVQEVATAPVADEDSGLNPDTEKLIFHYRAARKETADV